MAVAKVVAPIEIGKNAKNIPALLMDFQRSMHLLGRYFITMFDLSGFDIALWDAAEKTAALKLCRLTGGRLSNEILGSSSLYNYSEPDIVADKIGRVSTKATDM